MKRKTAKEILAESLKELAKTRKISKITVREITENCGYSSATFYRQFRDKYDLLAWDYLNYLKSNMLKVGTDGVTWRDAFLYSACYHYDNREYLANLIENTSGRYSFELYMAEANYDFIRQFLESRHGELGKKERRCLLTYCYGCVKFNSDWILGKEEGDPEEIAEMYEDMVPQILKGYIR